MKKSILVICVLCIGLNQVFAQLDTSLKLYSVTAQFDQECSAGVTITLFDKDAKQDSINQVILDELTHGFYDTKKTVSLKNLYGNKTADPTHEFMFTLVGSCSYHKSNIFSFVACPYNACEKGLYSNYEATMLTMDMEAKREITLQDLIDPAKLDSLEKYIYAMVTRYHIKNVPTCYVSGYNPLQIKGSKNVVTASDTVTYEKGLADKFYIKDRHLFVFNNVTRRDYNFTSIEVPVPLFNARYFFRKEFQDRF